MSPEISVVIPCFNAGEYLVEAVASVINQRWNSGEQPEIEIIIVDDHSDDSEALAILEQVKAYQVVRVIKNQGNKGVSAARNCGIREAHGKWIAFLDADDVWLPESLSVRWAAIKLVDDVQWLSSDYKVQMENGRFEADSFYQSHALPFGFLREAYTSGKALRLSRPIAPVLQVNLTWMGTVMVTRALLHEVGGFDESLRKSEDTALWIALANKTDLLFLPIVTALYKQRAGSLCHDSDAPYNWEIRLFVRLLRDNKMAPYKALISKRLLSCLEENILYYRRQGQRFLALRHVLATIGINPARPRAWKNLMASVLGR